MLNPKGLKKSRFSPKRLTTPEIWDEKLCILRDYENVNISSFAVLDIKLWLEENCNLDTDRLLYSFKFTESNAQNCHQVLSSFSHNFISHIANQKTFAYL